MSTAKNLAGLARTALPAEYIEVGRSGHMRTQPPRGLASPGPVLARLPAVVLNLAGDVAGRAPDGRTTEDCFMILRARRSTLLEALRVRKQAAAVLCRLLEDRTRSERRLAELGQRDQFKAITGRSSMENAILTTRVMIERMDTVIAEMKLKSRALRPSRPKNKTARPKVLQAGASR